MTTKDQWRRYSRKRRATLDALKTNPCMDCNGTYPPYVLDWDHRPNEVKLFNISTERSRPLQQILEEIDKCDLVCANCHRVRTYNRRKIYAE